MHDVLTLSFLSDNEEGQLPDAGEGIGAQLPDHSAAHSDSLGRGQWTAPNAPESVLSTTGTQPQIAAIKIVVQIMK